MSIGMQLISRIIRTGAMDEVLQWGIHEDDFITPEERGWFKELHRQYVLNKKAIVGPDAARALYPSFTLTDDNTPSVILCEEVRKRRLQHDLRQTALRLTDMAEKDPMQGIEFLQGQSNLLRTVTSRRNTDMNFHEGVRRSIDRYFLAKQGELSKFPLPWNILNKGALGYQESDYIILYGRPKSMKSFVLGYMAADAYMEHEKCVGIVTKEMTPDELYQRMMATCLRFPYQDVRGGSLPPQQESELPLFMDYIHDRALATNGRHNMIVMSGQDMAVGQDNISWVQTKIEQYNFDILFIDGLYLLSAENVSKRASVQERVASISRACRQMQLRMGIPVVATLQANRKAAMHAEANFDEIGMSDAFGQDCTMALRVINEKTGPTLALVLAGSRSFKLHGFRTHGVPCEDFTEICELTEKEIRKASDNDQSEEEGPVQSRRGGRNKTAVKGGDPVLESIDHTLRSIR